MSIMLSLRQGLGEWISQVPICANSTNDNVSVLDLPNVVKLPEYMPCALMWPGFFSQDECTLVVTEDFYSILNARNNTKIPDELLHPRSFFCSLVDCNILSLRCRICYGALLGASPRNCSTVQQEHESRLPARIISIGLETSSSVTLYTEFLRTSINQEHFFSSF